MLLLLGGPAMRHSNSHHHEPTNPPRSNVQLCKWGFHTFSQSARVRKANSPAGDPGCRNSTQSSVSQCAPRARQSESESLMQNHTDYWALWRCRRSKRTTRSWSQDCQQLTEWGRRWRRLNFLPALQLPSVRRRTTSQPNLLCAAFARRAAAAVRRLFIARSPTTACLANSPPTTE